MDDTHAQTLAEQSVAAMMASDAFSRWMGMEVLDIRPHAVRVRMTVTGDMLNGFGVCHGGAVFSLADSALAFASNTHGQTTVSIENSMTYPAPIREGAVLIASAEREAGSNRLGFYRVVVTRGDDLVALFRGTVYTKRSAESVPQ